MLHTYSVGTILEGTIEKIVFGGKGLLRTEGRFVVFVPFTIPGEVIRCRITGVKKHYAEADLLKILKRSPDRITPHCPYFGTCGGCQLQHMTYPLHLAYKQASVEEAIRKVYPEASISIEPADPLWGYRRHITWNIQNGLGGFMSIKHELMEVDSCPIFWDIPNPLFNKVATLIKQLSPQGKAKVAIVKKEESFLLLFHLMNLPHNFSQIAEKALDNTIEGISAQTPQGTKVVGNFDLQFTLKELQFHYHPACFIQNNPTQSAKIYQTLEALVSRLTPKYIIDLYCGIGVSTLLSAPYAQKVDGVEWNTTAIACAVKNASTNGISNVKYHSAAVEKALAKLLSNSPDLAIINPPRTGLNPDVAFKLASSSIQNVIYISCQPATLARDLNFFKENGFKLEMGKAFDMFPQTGHVEALIHLRKS